MRSTDKRALVIAHEPDGPGTQVAIRLEERGFTIETHVVTPDESKPNEALPFPDTSGYDLIVAMGSVRSLTRPDEISSWLDDELNLIRHASEIGKPLLGVCFGGQLIAHALGGSVEVAPVTEMGWVEIEAVDGVENPVGPGPWLQWHHDRFVPPPGARLLARSEHAPQLFTIGRMVGTQFHPEVDVEHVAKWLESVDDAYLDAYGQSRESMLADVIAHEAKSITGCKALVDWFLDEVAFPADAGGRDASGAALKPSDAAAAAS